MTTDERAARPAFRTCGVRIDAISLEDAARVIVAGELTGAVHLCNAYTLSLASKDEHLAAVLERGTLNLPDGMPLIWIARRLGFENVNDRVYGPDLMVRIIDLGQAAGTRHFLYGSTPDVLEALASAIARRWPSAEVTGAIAPAFNDDMSSFEASFETVAASNADVVWIGLGTPKQDIVADRLSRRTGAAIVCVGAAFDFISGTKPQAPAWLRTRGLEWAYRLATEPRRLWRRYLVGNSRFVWQVLRRPPTVLYRDVAMADAPRADD